jgi:hypothetical protein
MLPLPTVLKNLHSIIILKSDLDLNRVLMYQYNPYKAKLVLFDTWRPNQGKHKVIKKMA